MHNIPGMAVGTFAIRPGPMMAAFDMFDVLITGRGGHAASPHLTVDPITVGTKVVEGFQSIVSRILDTQEPAVLSVTQFHGGDAFNVIPNEVQISGCTRSFSPRTQDRLEASMRDILSGVCAAYGATFEFTYDRRYPPTINSANEAEIAGQVAVQVVGIVIADVGLDKKTGHDGKCTPVDATAARIDLGKSCGVQHGPRGMDERVLAGELIVAADGGYRLVEYWVDVDIEDFGGTGHRLVGLETLGGLDRVWTVQDVRNGRPRYVRKSLCVYRR